MTASGFPAMRHLGGRALERQLDSYVDRIVDHDLIEAGVRRPAAVRAWLRAYAAATGTPTSFVKIRNAATNLDPDEAPASPKTIHAYGETLTLLRILDPIDGWSTSNNHLSSLTSAPKHYLADPALAARLVRLSASKLIEGTEPSSAIPRDGTFLGGLFENLAALSIRTLAEVYGCRVYHLRTKGGRHEVDFIVETDEGILAFEAKLGSRIDRRDVEHLVWLKEILGPDCIDTVVVHTGPEAYRRQDGVAVVPLVLLGI